MEPFEAVRHGSCDDCDEYGQLNEHSFCVSCHNSHEAFGEASMKVRAAGGTREEAFKAGDDAVKALSKPSIEDMMANAHPDSILGCMAGLKRSLDAFHAEALPMQNEAVAAKLRDKLAEGSHVD